MLFPLFLHYVLSKAIKAMKTFAALFVAACMAASFPAFGQESVKDSKQENKQRKTAFVDRWSLKFNAVDFLFTVPNLGVEFDLSKSPYNRFTAGVNGRYRWWNTDNATEYILNIKEVRPEVRYYWRNRQKDGTIGYNAYYMGVYGAAGNYSTKISHFGYKGLEYGAGFTFGWGIPLYGYRKFVIDLELGISAGLIATDYSVYTYDSDADIFVNVPEKDKDMHILPFPVLTEVKATFVLRRLSIADKYRKVNQAKVIRRQERQDRRLNNK